MVPTETKEISSLIAAHEAGCVSAKRFRGTEAAASGIQADLEKVRFKLLSLWKVARL